MIYTNNLINKVDVKSNITIVTAFFTMKSKFTQDTYKNWMTNFLTLDEYMVIFTDIHNYEYISSLRNNSNTFIIVTSIEKFEVAKYMDYWKYCHSIDIENFRHTVELYMIWNEKTYFVDKAVHLNPFDSQYFFWMDIGCIRDVNLLKYINKFYVDGIPENKTILSAVTHTIPSNYFNENKISVSFENRNGLSCVEFNYIQGGFFGGHKNAIKNWVQMYTDELSLFIRTKTFGGKDQYIMNNIYLKYSEHLHIIQPKIFDFIQDPWFSFLIRMNNLSSYL